MTTKTFFLSALILLPACLRAATPATAPATTQSAVPAPLVASQPLSDLVTAAVRSVQTAHPDYKLVDNDISVTLIDMRNSASLPTGQFRGGAPMYPASVVKLFYLAYAHHLLDTNQLRDTPELQRGLNAMIVDSDNDATAYILYATTDAPNGAELPEREMANWSYKRNAVNRYFTTLGYPNVNACQTPYSFGPFGREREFLGPHFENRNSLTTLNTSLLLAQIVRHQMVTPERCDQMLALLHRDYTGTSKNPDDQAHGYTAMALPPDYKLYSKAGWNNSDRHDAAYVESPDGKLKFILTTYTIHHARQHDIIPAIAKEVLKNLPSLPAAP